MCEFVSFKALNLLVGGFSFFFYHWTELSYLFPSISSLYAELSYLVAGNSHIFTIQTREQSKYFHLTLGEKANECILQNVQPLL